MLNPDPATSVSQALPPWIELVKALVWPAVALVGLSVFCRPLLAILRSLGTRVDAGASIKIYSVEVGQAPTNLPVPSIGEAITANHMALIHSSWRYPKKDAEFGRRMWVFHVIVQARDEVVDRIVVRKVLSRQVVSQCGSGRNRSQQSVQA